MEELRVEEAPRGMCNWRWITVAGGLAVVPACRLQLDQAELDRLNRTSEARTIVLEDRFSLYSTFPLAETTPYVEIVRQELELVSALFGVEIRRPLLGRLTGAGAIRPSVKVQGGNVTARWLGGTAGDGEFSIYLLEEFRIQGADGSTVVVPLGERKYRLVIRHELAHNCAELIGIRDKLWLTEGIAEEVESMAEEGGKLRPVARPANLELAARLLPERRSLASVLGIRQDGERIARGLDDVDTEARALSHALVRYFLEKHRHLSFREALVRVDRMSRDEILAAEDAFYRWLAGFTREAPGAAGGAGASGGAPGHAGST